MSKKDKHLCDWKKEERVEKLASYRDLVKKPKFMCADCGRVAAKKKWLCEPISLN